MKTAGTIAGWCIALGVAGAAGQQWVDWLGWPGMVPNGLGAWVVGRMLGAWTLMRHPIE